MAKNKTTKSAPAKKKGPQGASDALDFYKVFDSLKLRHVRLVGLNTSVFITGSRTPDHAEITAQTGMGPTPDGKNLNINLEIKVEARPKGLKDDCSLLLVDAKYQCVFSLEGIKFDSLIPLSEPLCEVGMRVAWPYVRELVQTITARMSIPPVIMPILVQPPPKQP